MTLRFGRYETLRAIASGGMATVYLGRALGAGGFERLVAIKVMHPHIADDPEFVAMFLDEARLAARVRHPNVVATIDVQQLRPGEGGGVTGPQLFIVMEYIEGPSLQFIQKELRTLGRMMPIAQSLRIFLDGLAGLHAAHELIDSDGSPLNLIHRDVSPQNLIVGSDGITRITDFGVARAESRLSSTRGGQLKGKIAYMAPEQIRSEPIDRRCDVYAAGVLLWEMLVGQKLFRAENDGAMVAKILAGAPRSPRSFNPDVPPDVDAVCMRALRLSPQERWQTAADFADALEDAANLCGVGVANARGLAAYVRGLEIPVPTAVEPPSRAPRPPASGSGSHSSKAPSTHAPASVEPGSSSSQPRTGSTQVGAVMSYVPARKPRRTGLYALAGMVLIGAGAGLFYAGRMAGGVDSGAGTLTRANEPAAAGRADAPPAESQAPAGTATPAADVPPAASPAVASASAMPAGASAKPGAIAAPARAPRPRTPPPPPPSPKTAPPSPTSFKPNDL